MAASIEEEIESIKEILNLAYQDVVTGIQSWYSKLEFSAGGLALYAAAFMLFLLPLLIFTVEHLTGRDRSSAAASPKPQKTLPKASSTLPIPEPSPIKEVRVYPIKSCRGIVVPAARMLETGLDLDRNWMFVDAGSLKFLTIRQISKMTLIETSYDAGRDELQVAVRGRPEAAFTVAAHPDRAWLDAHTELVECEIWGKKTDGFAYAAALTDPISAFLGKQVRLLYKGPRARALPDQARPAVLGREGSTKFADFMPVLVANERSIEELNGRLKELGEREITIEHFRPNLVVDGHEAWEEDTWKTVRIVGGQSDGEAADAVTMDIPVRCARCQVPNVDPETGVKDREQPWKELMKYRNIDEGIRLKPCFGMLCVPRSGGLAVSTGMRFEVLEVTSEHNWNGALEE